MAESSSSSNGLGRLMAKGAAWVVGSRLAIRLLGLASTVILARLLIPADFGIVAIATLMVASVELLSSFNFEIWIIRHATPDRSHYNTVWTLSLIRGFVTCAVLYLTAGPASVFFDEPHLETVLAVLAIQAALDSFHNIGIVDFQKNLEFDKDFLILAGSKLGAFLVTVGSAFYFLNYWALVAGILSGTLVKLVLSYRMHPFRPGLSLLHWREIFAFSKWLMFGNLLGFLYLRSDTFILGRLMNSQSLGLYSVAHEIANLASSEIVAPIRRVMLPGYSKLTGDHDRLRRSFMDGLGIIMLIGVPIAAGIGLVAEPLVWVLLGEKWLDAVPLVRVLAIYGIASVAMANQVPLLIAMGDARLLAILTGAGLVVLIPGFIWASMEYGLTGGAWALSLTNVLVFFGTLGVTLKRVEIPVSEAFKQTWRTALAAAAMAVTVVALQAAIPEMPGALQIVPLAACAVSGALVYTGTILTLWHFQGQGKGPEGLILEFLRVRGDPTHSQGNQPDGS